MERVLIVSANIGEGHNATGRALEGAVRERWPGATVQWLDTLDVLGPGFGPLLRRTYVANVESTPGCTSSSTPRSGGSPGSPP